MLSVIKFPSQSHPLLTWALHSFTSENITKFALSDNGFLVLQAASTGDIPSQVYSINQNKLGGLKQQNFVLGPKNSKPRCKRAPSTTEPQRGEPCQLLVAARNPWPAVSDSKCHLTFPRLLHVSHFPLFCVLIRTLSRIPSVCVQGVCMQVFHVTAGDRTFLLCLNYTSKDPNLKYFSRFWESRHSRKPLSAHYTRQEKY